MNFALSCFPKHRNQFFPLQQIIPKVEKPDPISVSEIDTRIIKNVNSLIDFGDLKNPVPSTVVDV